MWDIGKQEPYTDEDIARIEGEVAKNECDVLSASRALATFERLRKATVKPAAAEPRPGCECGWEFPAGLTLHVTPDAPVDAPDVMMMLMVECPRCHPNAAGHRVSYSMRLDRRPGGGGGGGGGSAGGSGGGGWWRWFYRRTGV